MEQVLLALLVGKTHRVMTRLFRLAADLAALHLLVCPRGSAIEFGVTRTYSRNQPLDQGSTTGSNLAVGPVLCALSVLSMFTYCVAVANGETNDARLDGFLVHWVHSHRRATEHGYN